MREIRADGAGCRRAAHRVARAAAGGEKQLAPAPATSRGRLGGGAGLALQPRLELGRRHGDHLERHQRVRAAAVLRALAAEHARLIRAQAQVRGAARDHVHLAAEVRHPEAMDDVGGLQREEDGTAGGNADLVGGGDRGPPVLRIGDAPPPLLAHHLDAERAVIIGGTAVLARVSHTP